MLLRCCLSDFEIVPVAPVITGITFVLHSICAVLLLLGLHVAGSSWLLALLHVCLEITTYINMHVPFLLSRIMISHLLLGIVVTVCTVGSKIR
jgi:hypothetical protein